MSFIGNLLRNVRSGDAKLAINHPVTAFSSRLHVSSSAFADGSPIGAPYVGGKGESPPLAWEGAPESTQSYAIVVQDVDVPFPTPVVHAVAYGIAPTVRELPAAALPRAGSKAAPHASVTMGRCLIGRVYMPPTPIPGHGPHRYVFQVFALDNVPRFVAPPHRMQLLAAMNGHLLACGSVTGTYET